MEPEWRESMKSIACSVLIVFFLTASLFSEKIVIAHRGASGYLPEHSMEAKAMAYAMGADYIEQDLVMTRDGHLVVLHDHYLDRVTDVDTVFPDRKRADGRYYVIDFTLDEIRHLRMTEGFEVSGGVKKQIYPGRFPLWKSSFKVHTFEEEIEMIQGLNHSTGRKVGLYPEVKSPWFHRKEGMDISRKALETLKAYGYSRRCDKIFLQCFDPVELLRIRRDLNRELGMDLKLVQLIAMTDWSETMIQRGGKYVPYSYDWMMKPGAMKRIAEYADGVGPWLPMVVRSESSRGNIQLTGLVEEAHQAGLQVHPYTFRKDAGQIPGYAADFEELLDIFLNRAHVDGVFSDFPDRAAAFIHQDALLKHDK